MLRLFFLVTSVIFLFVTTSAMLSNHQFKRTDDSPSPLKSERRSRITEYIYLAKVYKLSNAKETDNGEKANNQEELKNENYTDDFVCRKMVKLRRVPLCLRLFDQPHYKDTLKIKFNYLAYRGNKLEDKPQCTKKSLAFHTQSTYNGIQQEMLLCPGRHDPLRSSWELDDYSDVFYVSSGAATAPSIQTATKETEPTISGRKRGETISFSKGVQPTSKKTGFGYEATNPSPQNSGFTLEETGMVPKESKTAQTYIRRASESTQPGIKNRVPDSLIVYKRESDADTDQFFIYDIIENFKPNTLPLAIVTEYDVEKEQQSTNAVTYNNNVKELEVIYIREMIKPLSLFSKRDAQLSREDKIAHLTQSELVSLCWLILDQPQYQDIDFEPHPPLKKNNEDAIIPEQNLIHFKYSTNYNEKSVKQTMYACKPRRKSRSLRGIANANPKRIQISSGARQYSYFVYILNRDKNWGKYRLYELVENLQIKPGISTENYAEIKIEDEVTVDSATEHNTEDFEKKFIEVVHKKDRNNDIVCKKLNRDQLRALCIRLFKTYHYAEELKIFFNYRQSLSRLEFCQQRKITLLSAQLQSTTEIHHQMSVCEGRHDPLRSNYELDDYKDTFHVSEGPDEKSVMVFRQNKTADVEWFQVYDIVPIESLEKLEEVPIELNNIQEEYNRSLILNYNSNKPEIEVIYIREVLKSAPVTDTLAEQPEGKIIALCYELLGGDSQGALNFEISRAALFTWRTRIKAYRLVFAHSKEYNDEHLMQSMYPCYGKHKDSKLGWKNDEYLHQYKIFSGGRPHSFFLCALISIENQQRTYTLHKFVENIKIKTLKAVEIKHEEVQEELKYKNSGTSVGRKKTGNLMTTGIGKQEPVAIKPKGIRKSTNPISTNNVTTEPKSAEPTENVIKNEKPVQIHRNATHPVKSTSNKADRSEEVAVRNQKPIGTEQKEPPEVLKQVIYEEPTQTKQKTINGNRKLTTMKPREIAEVLTPVNKKNRITQSKPDAPIRTALKNSKPTETEREVPVVQKQVISEKLITNSKPTEQHKGIDSKNSKSTEQEIPEAMKKKDTRQRKTRTQFNDIEPEKIVLEKPGLVKSTKEIRPVVNSINSTDQITPSNSSKNTGFGKAQSIEEAIKFLKKVDSKTRSTLPQSKMTETDTLEPIKTDQRIF